MTPDPLTYLPGKQPVRNRRRASEPVRAVGVTRMSSKRRSTIFVGAVLLNVALLGMVAAASLRADLSAAASGEGEAPGQAAPAPAQPAQPMAEQVFKNIQVLKGIPADEFMD